MSDAISGLRLNIIDANGLKKTAYFTREDLRIGVEGNGTINNWLDVVQETENVTTTTSTAAPTTESQADTTTTTTTAATTTESSADDATTTTTDSSETIPPQTTTPIPDPTPLTPAPSPAPEIPTINVVNNPTPLANPSLPTINVQQQVVPLAEIVTITIQQSQIPQTGENGFAWIGFMLLLAAGGVYVGVRRYEKSMIKE